MLHDFKAPHDAVMLDDGSILVNELGSKSVIRASGEHGKDRTVVIGGLEGPVGMAGGAKGVVPEVSLLLELAKEFPNFGYVKEEYVPVVQRMSELAAHRPAIKGVFSENAGIDLLYEMRLGFDGTMPGAPYADLYAQVWDLYHSGEQQKARDLFGKLLLMINLDEQIPGARQYMMKRRGVFKTSVSRQRDVKLSPEAIQEIEFNFETLRPYLKA